MQGLVWRTTFSMSKENVKHSGQACKPEIISTNRKILNKPTVI